VRTPCWSMSKFGLIRFVAAAALAACGVAAFAEDKPPAKPDAKTEAKAAERLPVPPAAGLSDSEKQIKEAFKADYQNQKKDTAARIELAKKLLKLGEESENDALTRYVAEREAKDLAASASDLDTAFAAADALARSFIVDGAELKVSAFTAAARNIATAEAAEEISSAGLNLLDCLARDAQFDAALKLVTLLDDVARRGNKPELARTLQARSKDLRAQQSEWAKVKPCFDKLKEDPANADAALAVAKYYIAAKDDWEHALPLLARGPAAPLKDAATQDLAKPEDATARADLGDLWCAAADKESGPLKAAMQGRAMLWYAQALDGVSGVRKLQIEQRMKALTEAGTGEWSDLLALVNPAKHAVAGKWVKQGGELEVASGPHTLLEIPRNVRGSYELQAVFTVKEGPRHEAGVIVPVGTAQTSVMLDGWDGVSGLGNVNGVPPISAVNPTAVRPAHGLLALGRKYVLIIRVQAEGANAEIYAELNGRKVFDWRGKQTALSVFAGWPVSVKSKACVCLGTCTAGVLWHSVRMRGLGGGH